MGNKTYHRPRHTHHQVRGHLVTPRNHLHANQTPRTRSQRRSGGVCVEGEPVLRPTLSPSRQTPAVSEAETHTATPPPAPRKVWPLASMCSGDCPPPPPRGRGQLTSTILGPPSGLGCLQWGRPADRGLPAETEPGAGIKGFPWPTKESRLGSAPQPPWQRLATRPCPGRS